MFPNYCCCCLKTNEILLPIKTKSSHADGKMLLNYFDFVFGTLLQEQDDVLNYICKRCSKALQVTYHFINMVKESKERSNEIILDNLSFKEVPHKIQVDQNSPSTLKNNHAQVSIESQLKCPTNTSAIPSNQLVPLKLSNNFETFGHDSNTVGGSSVSAKECNIDIMCNICNKLFENKHRFFEHNKQMHKEITPYKCKLCTFYTCYTASLFKHCEKSHGLNNVALDLYRTEKVFKQVDDNPKFVITYLCIPCNFKVYSQASMDEHLFKEHSMEEDMDSFVKENFDCPLCYRSFMNLKSAKIHYGMSHTCALKKTITYNKRKFECEKCGKFFDLKTGLFLHRRVCVERNAVKCNFCNLQFNSVLKYERHLPDNHSVAIKHECEICCKTFSCSEYLTVHRKRHNERYYQCDLCPKNYITNADLKVHKQRIHATKHVSTICTVCGKKFANSTLLKYHENKAHNKRFFK